MKTALLKIMALCLGISFSACSTFYTRHYTKGIFYDGFAHNAQAPAKPEKSRLSEARQAAPDSSQIITHTHPEEKVSATKEKAQIATP